MSTVTIGLNISNLPEPSSAMAGFFSILPTLPPFLPPQISIIYVLCVRNSVRYLGFGSEQERKSPCPHRAYITVEEIEN